MNECCQSCGMPMDMLEFAKEKDGKSSAYYCVNCYRDGEFMANISMNDLIEINGVLLADKLGISIAEAKKLLYEKLPELKRWKD